LVAPSSLRDALPIERERAVLEERAPLVGGTGLEVRLGLSDCELGPFEEGDDLVEDGAVASDFDILGDDVREPEQVIGDPGSDAAAAGRVPPVLDVALAELPRRSAQHMLPRERG